MKDQKNVKRSKVQQAQNFLKKKNSVSVEKDFLFQFHTHSPLVLLFISKFPMHNLEPVQWFLLTLKH